MLRFVTFSAAVVAALFVTTSAQAQSGSRGAVPSVPAFSAPVQSAPAIGGSGTSFGARQTFSQPTPAIGGSGSSFRSTSPSTVTMDGQPVYSQPEMSYSQPQTVYSQPQMSSSSCGCGSSAPAVYSAPAIYSAPVTQAAPMRFFRRGCGCCGGCGY